MSDLSGLPETRWGSADHHQRVMVVAPDKRRKCRQCGDVPRHAATHVGTANGMGLMMGCEWAARQWVAAQDSVALARYRATGEL